MHVRYYADADIREHHEHVLRLLRQLHDEHGLVVEIERIDEQHGPIRSSLARCGLRRQKPSTHVTSNGIVL